MSAPDVLKELVERFDAFKETYLSNKYKEIELRQEFLNPLFEALGWDLYNLKGYADAYKEVIHEVAIKIGGRTKAPDYCFRAGGGQRSFFVEAKKPSVNIGDAISPAYQLRRYAWSAKLPVSILTDFEEFAVYDCRIRPDKDDKASTARVIYLNYSEYIERWDELYGLFSPEAIRKGSLEKFVTSKRIKKGTAEVDKEFLSEIEGWRTDLARHLALRNEGLSPRELNFSVQRIIDRIIFLRICEDRGIEPYATLESLQNAPNIYRRMRELFQRADDRYNSGLFHFTPEKDRSEPPDELTLDLTVDDKPLQEILGGLYYPESPYEFSVFPVEILGQVYEQFLGKVIRLTKGHQAKVEEKSEVRKAGGVYYTPSYIVDYIVRHTVGKLLNGEPFSREPEASAHISHESFSPGTCARSDGNRTTLKGVPRGKYITPAYAAKLRILDPACGSGSFLLGAYQFLLDWHRDWYINNDFNKYAKGRNPKLYKSYSGDWRLTSAERKRILLNNIYGVDIDEQAVEVTKLSLLLKVLEGESGETVDNQIRLFHQRALPDLGDNIKCGNSLIGPDFYNGNQLKLFDDEEQLRVNAFDWHDKKLGFGKIMAAGGFDAVIGNPPYVRIQTLNETQPKAVDYFKLHYRTAIKGNYDIYILFIEKGLSLLKQSGLQGYICPHKFFNAKYGEALRELISRDNHLFNVVHFGHQQVFSGASTYTCMLILNKNGCKEFGFVRVDNIDEWLHKGIATKGLINSKEISVGNWNIHVGNGKILFDKLRKSFPSFGSQAERIAQGLRTSANEVYVLDIVKTQKQLFTCFSAQVSKKVLIDRNLMKYFLQGKEIKRYAITPSNKGVIIPYELIKGRMEYIPETEMRIRFPNTYNYFLKNKDILQLRERKRMRGPFWYGYVYPKNLEIMSKRKILVPDIADRASFALDKEGQFAFTSGYAITLKREVPETDLYILGLLNSKLLDFFLKRISTTLRGGYFRYFTQYIEQLPIRTIDFTDKADKRRHDRMVSLVETMLELNKKVAEMKAGHERTVVGRQIAATDRQIDQLVYELYGLTDEEIAIVEKQGA
jgi:predicted type IV restriction endonuclease